MVRTMVCPCAAVMVLLTTLVITRRGVSTLKGSEGKDTVDPLTIRLTVVFITSPSARQGKASQVMNRSSENGMVLPGCTSSTVNTGC